MQKGRVLFFTPEALVAPHIACQCNLGRTLKELGHEVLFVRCYGSLTRCPSKDMVSAPFEVGTDRIRDVCHNCITHSLSYLSHYGLDAVTLGDYLNQEDLDKIHESVFNAKDDLSTFVYDGIEFGKITTRDLTLATKICDFKNIDQTNLAGWILYIHSCLSSYIAADRMIKERGITQIVRFNEYATNIGAAFAGYKNNIPVITTSQASHMGVDRRLVVIMSELGPFTHRTQMKDWPKWEGLALAPEQVTKVADDVISRCGSTSAHVYSTAKTLTENTILHDLGLSYGTKTLVAFTSSIDEDVSYRLVLDALGKPLPLINKPFADQIEWLTELTRYVESSTDLQLIVRVHPREGKNKRDAVGSQHLTLLRESFDRPFMRCRFVWPESPISSYDLVELADVGLTSWSSIGLEMARLGVPNLTAWHDVGFPEGDFHPWGGPSKEDYFRKLTQLINAPLRIDHMIKAFRCYHQFQVMKALDLSDIVPGRDDSSLIEFKLPREAKTIEEVIIGNRPLREINLERMRLQQRPDSCEQEEDAIRTEITRLLHYFLTGELELPREGLTIVDSRKISSARDVYDGLNGASGASPRLYIDGKTLIYHYRGSKLSRFTPLLARLASYLECHYANFKSEAAAICRSAQPRFLS